MDRFDDVPKSDLVVEPYWGDPEHVTSLIPCASDRWQREIDIAKSADAWEAREQLASDPTKNLCAVQRGQVAAGYVVVEISSNKYGFCVRDTLDGRLGYLCRAYPGGRGSAERAIEYARKWHAAGTQQRAVVQGYIGSDVRAEWDAAIRDATSAPLRRARVAGEMQ